MLLLVHVLVMPLVMAAVWGWAVARGPIDGWGYAALLAGTATAYLGDRWRDPGAAVRAACAARPWLARLLAAGTLLAALVTAGAALLGDPMLVIDLVILALLATSLVLTRRLPLGKELTVGLVWALACHGLPAGAGFWSQLQAGVPLSFWLQVALFAIGTALCDVKDAAHDRREGYRNLAALVSVPQLQVSALVALAVCAVGAAQGGQRQLLPVCIALAAVACWGRLLRQPIWSAIAVDGALCLLGVAG